MRNSKTRDNARAMRAEPTDVERVLWRHLRQRQLGGWRFRRQHPIPPYIADFACVEARLIVEADGGQHAGSSYDEARDRYLRRLGWRVLRLWNSEIRENPEGVMRLILEALDPHPNPPPLGGGGD